MSTGLHWLEHPVELLKQQRRREESLDLDAHAHGNPIQHPTLCNSATSATGIGGRVVNFQAQCDAPSFPAGIAPVELDIVEDGRVQSLATLPLSSSSRCFIVESMPMEGLVAGQQVHEDQRVNLPLHDLEVRRTCIMPAGCKHSSFMLLGHPALVGGRTSSWVHSLPQ